MKSSISVGEVRLLQSNLAGNEPPSTATSSSGRTRSLPSSASGSGRNRNPVDVSSCSSSMQADPKSKQQPSGTRTSRLILGSYNSVKSCLLQQANFLCDFHPSTTRKGNAGLGNFCILETSFSFLKTSFWHFEIEFQQFLKDYHHFFHQNLHISHVFPTTYPKDGLEMASNHTKTSFSSTNLHKNAGKRVL